MLKLPNRSLRLTALCGALWAAPHAAAAQIRIDPSSEGRPISSHPSGWYGGFDLLAAQPVGEFRDHVRFGGGIGGSFIKAFGESGVLALRADAGYLIYGQHHFTAPFYGSRGLVNIDFTTTNAIAFFGVGPHLMAPNGLIRPYAAGTVGFANFITGTSAQGSGSGYDFASTTNAQSATFAWAAMGGLYVPIRRGVEPISLDLGVRYHGNGRARYLTPASITQNAAGSSVITPIESETRFLTYRLGIMIGLR
ncbi:MAG: hypothetical protein NVS4B3_15750 [Gemmatimonadaceae bacterium]